VSGKEAGHPTASPLVDTQAGLEEVCRRLREAGAFALDTEFVKERTFFAQLGTVQVATRDFAVIIDPRAVTDLVPFAEIWADPQVEKIIHSGFQDCEVLFQSVGAPPRNVFDTQIAAAILGYGDQIAYAKLAALVVGVKLRKLETRTDWTRRPLTKEQIQYALDDVRYLPRLREHLGERLADLGREAWAYEEFRFLEDPATFELAAPEEAYLRLRVNALNVRQRGALRELAAWREREARRRDLPRGWVLSDGALLEIARRLPKSREALARVRALESKDLERNAAAILAAVTDGSEAPVEAPASTGTFEESPETEALTRLLDAWLRARAQSTETAVSLLGTRDDVKALAAGYLRGELPDVPLLSGWRRQVVGQDLLDLLDGKLRLSVAAGGRIVAERVGEGGA